MGNKNTCLKDTAIVSFVPFRIQIPNALSRADVQFRHGLN